MESCCFAGQGTRCAVLSVTRKVASLEETNASLCPPQTLVDERTPGLACHFSSHFSEPCPFPICFLDTRIGLVSPRIQEPALAICWILGAIREKPYNP